MNEINKFLKIYNIPVFEDCCEAHGASIDYIKDYINLE